MLRSTSTLGVKGSQVQILSSRPVTSGRHLLRCRPDLRKQSNMAIFSRSGICPMWIVGQGQLEQIWSTRLQAAKWGQGLLQDVSAVERSSTSLDALHRRWSEVVSRSFGRTGWMEQAVKGSITGLGQESRGRGLKWWVVDQA